MAQYTMALNRKHTPGYSRAINVLLNMYDTIWTMLLWFAFGLAELVQLMIKSLFIGWKEINVFDIFQLYLFISIVWKLWCSWWWNQYLLGKGNWCFDRYQLFWYVTNCVLVSALFMGTIECMGMLSYSKYISAIHWKRQLAKDSWQ